MAVVKTAISINEPLFHKLEELAAELGMSRSRLLALALEEFLERYENLRVLEALNAAYDDDQQDEELELVKRHKPGYREVVEDSW
jgi:metal-responsive CopG/Arc/MetJ family transcriptional regulator